MKLHAVILSSSVILGFITAGCGCDSAPMEARAETKRPATTKQQSAAQKFAPGIPLETPTFPGTPNTPAPPYQLDAPAPPYVASNADSNGIVLPPTNVPFKSAPAKINSDKVSESRPAVTRQKSLRGRRVDGRAWGKVERNSVAPTTKAGRTASSDIMGPS